MVYIVKRECDNSPGYFYTNGKRSGWRMGLPITKRTFNDFLESIVDRDNIDPHLLTPEGYAKHYNEPTQVLAKGSWQTFEELASEHPELLI